jgi:hypothetical protein
VEPLASVRFSSRQKLESIPSRQSRNQKEKAGFTTKREKFLFRFRFYPAKAQSLKKNSTMKNPLTYSPNLAPLRLCGKSLLSESGFVSRQVAKAQSLENRGRKPINLFSELGAFAPLREITLNQAAG